MTRITSIFFILAAMVTFVISGCGGKSTRDLLIGTWTNEGNGQTNNITFHVDGTFNAKLETGSWGIFTPTLLLISGDWSLQGKTIKYTIRKSSYMNEQFSGMIVSETIMSINDSTLVVREDGAKGQGVDTWIRNK
jgi:hypothetical protein